MLDVSKLVVQLGGPACVPEEAVVVDESNGVVYSQQNLTGWQAQLSAHHSYGMQSSPWHIKEVGQQQQCVCAAARACAPSCSGRCQTQAGGVGTQSQQLPDRLP